MVRPGCRFHAYSPTKGWTPWRNEQKLDQTGLRARDKRSCGQATDFPSKHWELDAQVQPTQEVIEQRRKAAFITPIPKPRKRKAAGGQQNMVFDEGNGLSSENQQYALIPIINELRQYVSQWRELPNPKDWAVTPETARLLQHWRTHPFNNYRPLFCQLEAVETVFGLAKPTIAVAVCCSSDTPPSEVRSGISGRSSTRNRSRVPLAMTCSKRE